MFGDAKPGGKEKGNELDRRKRGPEQHTGKTDAGDTGRSNERISP